MRLPLKRLLVLVGALAPSLAFAQILPGTLTVYNTGSADVFFLNIVDSNGHVDTPCPGSGCSIPGGQSGSYSVNTYYNNGDWTINWTGPNDGAPIYHLDIGQGGGAGGNPNIVAYISATGSGGSAPPSTNSLYCATINNTSGSPNYYGIFDVTVATALSIDGCGNNEIEVPAGGSQQICVTAPPGDDIEVFTGTGNTLGISEGCDPNALLNPDPQGNLSQVPLTGTPIPNGSPVSSVSNTNIDNVGFGSNGSVYTNGSGTNAPINFSASTNNLPSGGTNGEGPVLVIGFDAVYAELVNVANGIAKSDADGVASAAGVKSAVAAVGSDVLAGNADLVTINAQLQANGGVEANILTAVGSLGGVLTNNGIQLGAIESNTAYLAGISNLLDMGNGTLVGESNHLVQIVSNTSVIAGGLTTLSNYAGLALSLTNAAMGGDYEGVNWYTNVYGMTNYASGLQDDYSMYRWNEYSYTASVASGNVGIDPITGIDANFWTLGLTVGSTVYTFDLNPLDNPGIAEIASLMRQAEYWFICIFWILAVNKLLSDIVAHVASTTQLLANRTLVLGNSIGQVTVPLYLPIMVACMLAVPLFISGMLDGGIGANWLSAAFSSPFANVGSGVLGQSYCMADQFIPINFAVSSLLYYAAVRLGATPIWIGAVTIYKALVS